MCEEREGEQGGRGGGKKKRKAAKRERGAGAASPHSNSNRWLKCSRCNTISHTPDCTAVLLSVCTSVQLYKKPTDSTSLLLSCFPLSPIHHHHITTPPTHTPLQMCGWARLPTITLFIVQCSCLVYQHHIIIKLAHAIIIIIKLTKKKEVQGVEIF